MKDYKLETFVYEDLGFPVVLVNAPLRKSFGEWVIDIDFNKLRKNVLNFLIHKHSRLTGEELRFIRKHFEMTMTEFGKVFGVTHVAVLKWESGENRVLPTTDLCVRIFVLRKLHAKNEAFGELIYQVLPEQLSQLEKSSEPLRIEAFTVIP
jgi:DNA-binding transcriptional regulator YiaG